MYFEKETKLRLKQIVKNNPQLLDFMNKWRIHELESLPDRVDNVALGQGRCQILKEMCRFMESTLSDK